MAQQSQIRMNYATESEAGVNKQINLELYASYVYRSMAWHFNREDVALPGFHKFFSEAAKEEQEHAEQFMKFQNDRGGRIVLADIKKPAKDDWGTGLEAMKTALELEKSTNQALLDLTTIAHKAHDHMMSDFLEEHFLEEQVRSIKQIADYITQLERVGPGLGEFMFDREVLLEGDE